MAREKKPLSVEALKHGDATRRNIPTAELESVVSEEDKSPIQVAYERRNRDLDPQLVWRGKDEQDWSDLIVQAPPLYIQEKLHPKVLIDDLIRESKTRRKEPVGGMADLFADFNGLPDKEAATEFYQHDQHWSNRMILGDSLAVMASLAEREGLRGQVQCIYFDPPYGIKFNSNFQWSTTSRDVKDGAKDQITREPEQVRAFRDTWRDGIHSYLTYLRDRLTVARDLLNDSGSIFVQIGDENVHAVRSLLNEVFGEGNFVAQIILPKVTGVNSNYLAQNNDYILFFAKRSSSLKFRQPYLKKVDSEGSADRYDQLTLIDGTRRATSKAEKEDPSLIPAGAKRYQLDNLLSSEFRPDTTVNFEFEGRRFHPGNSNHWKTTTRGLSRLAKARRIEATKGGTIRYVRELEDFAASTLGNTWLDISGSVQSRTDPKIYVVQTSTAAVQRCLLMATDPGDLVLDPTCGSGTTAYVAEQWGRRWITIDTSRVSLALARSRIMGARFPYYLLADSVEGQRKEGEITRTPPRTTPTSGNVRFGFVYERMPRITLKSISGNTEIDDIWEGSEHSIEAILNRLNGLLSRQWQEWEVPRETEESWSQEAKGVHADWWAARHHRQSEIDKSIAARAEFEYLYDRPYADASRVRVAGPFTVESLSPHRTLAVGPDDELIDLSGFAEGGNDGFDHQDGGADFAQMVLKNLKAAGVQQAHKEDRIAFTGLTGWPGDLICAEGRYLEGDVEKRAGIFIGPEFGTVSRPDLVQAAREAGDAGFDVLVACAFNYDAHSAEFAKLGRVPVLRARMNPDLHMAGDLAANGAGNLFVIFGEPDIKIEDAGDGMVRVKVSGVDVFKPQTGEVVSEDTDGIALWMLDTDYNEESFFVRHAYFLGANDPYKALKTTLKAEIDRDAWDSLNSDTSRPFEKPSTGRIAVKVINHLGDEVMKIFEVR